MSQKSVRQPAWTVYIAACLTIGLAPALFAKEPLPEVTADGLELQKNTEARAVYLKPGVTFNQYQRVAILDCYVEFAKDWQRDYNNNVAGIQNRVNAQDMERIKARVAAEFKEVFTKELQTKGNYPVVDTTAPDVLVLRPAIINLIATAPDLQTAGMSRTWIDSAGQMTLYLELWDSATNTILARVLDPQADPGMGTAQIGDRVTNKAAVDRILREWAEKLRKHLEAVRDKAPAS